MAAFTRTVYDFTTARSTVIPSTSAPILVGQEHLSDTPSPGYYRSGESRTQHGFCKLICGRNHNPIRSPSGSLNYSCAPFVRDIYCRSIAKPNSISSALLPPKLCKQCVRKTSRRRSEHSKEDRADGDHKNGDVVIHKLDRAYREP
jgi:hypothetical protein